MTSRSAPKKLQAILVNRLCSKCGGSNAPPNTTVIILYIISKFLKISRGKKNSNIKYITHVHMQKIEYENIPFPKIILTVFARKMKA